ncbi:MAG: hypothetical protein Q9224_002700, partial [Gallowayella concinna]
NRDVKLTFLQSALFNFQSLLLVLLLLICTSAYAHYVFPGIMDRNRDGYVTATLPRGSRQNTGSLASE